jgi:hypothetical protein
MPISCVEITDNDEIKPTFYQMEFGQKPTKYKIPPRGYIPLFGKDLQYPLPPPPPKLLDYIPFPPPIIEKYQIKTPKPFNFLPYPPYPVAPPQNIPPAPPQPSDEFWDGIDQACSSIMNIPSKSICLLI